MDPCFSCPALAAKPPRETRLVLDVLLSNDLARAEVIKISRTSRIVARPLRIGIIVKPSLQRKVVKVRKQRWASVEPMSRLKVIKIDVSLAVIVWGDKFKAQVDMIDLCAGGMGVGAEEYIVGKRQRVDAVAKRLFAGEEGNRWRWGHGNCARIHCHRTRLRQRSAV